MRRTLQILVVLLAIVAIAAVAGLVALRLSLPNPRATHTVEGVSAPVRVVRDGHGVPHIEAATREDAAFGLGFVHAQDRLWQLELQRRIGSGRLAEAFGPSALNQDRFLRTLGVRRAAERTLAELSPTTRGVIDAYVAGINAWLARRPAVLPPTFLLTGVRPEPFEAVDVVAWAKMMAWDLSGEYGQELLRARLVDRLGSDRAAELFPPYPEDVVGSDAGLPSRAAAAGGPGSVRPPSRVDAATLDALAQLRPVIDALADLAPPAPLPGEGSNAFAVSARRSATGAPLLANDPHLGLQAPSQFYLVSLRTPDGAVAGATLPLTPAVLLGRTDRVAWGLTNTGADDQDLFLERIDPDDPSRYLTPDGSAPFEVREETIQVKGAEPVTITVRATRHGPVLSDLVGGDVAERAARDGPYDVVLALSWLALQPGDTTLDAALALSEAEDGADVRRALEDWTVPAQSIVFADADGSIGLINAGTVPIRADGDGNLPVPGWDGTHDWIGRVPPAARPAAIDPASGRVVAANQKTVASDYPHFVTDDWTAPYRAQRVADLLDSVGRHSPETFAAIQGDTVSLAAREFLPFLTSAPPLGALAREAQALLIGWDGRMDAARPEPLIYTAWTRNLVEAIFADELGDLFEPFRNERALLLRAVLGSQPTTRGVAPGERAPATHWCDDVVTEGVEDCERMSARALRDAVAELAMRYGDDPGAWRWGRAHPAVFDHIPLGDTVLRRAADVRVPRSGDAFTVDAAPVRKSRPYESHHGPVFRGVYDLSEGLGEGAAASRFVVAPGVSGNPVALRYRNLVGRWARGDSLAMTTDPQLVRRARAGTMTLAPVAPSARP